MNKRLSAAARKAKSPCRRNPIKFEAEEVMRKRGDVSKPGRAKQRDAV